MCFSKASLATDAKHWAGQQNELFSLFSPLNRFMPDFFSQSCPLLFFLYRPIQGIFKSEKTKEWVKAVRKNKQDEICIGSPRPEGEGLGVRV
jgi:hypothetical protein